MNRDKLFQLAFLTAFAIQISRSLLFAQTTFEWINPLPQGNTLNDVQFLSEQTALAVGEGGCILRSTDAGISWVRIDTRTDYGFTALSFVDELNGITVSWSGETLYTTDGGVTWAAKSTNSQGLLDVSLLTSNIGVASSYHRIFTTTDAGTTWNEKKPAITEIESVSMVNDSTIFAVGRKSLSPSRYWIIRSTDVGETWTQVVETTSNLVAVEFSQFVPELGIVVGNTGKIYRTLDGGNTWTEQSSGSTEALTAIDYIDDTTIVVCGSSGAVLTTSDAGDSWELQKTNTDQDLLSVAFNASRHGIVTAFDGFIMRSVDGGSTWSNIYQDNISSNLQGLYFFDKNYGLVAGDKTIAHTSDGGDTWRDIIGRNIADLNGAVFTDDSSWVIVGSGGVVLRYQEGSRRWHLENLQTTTPLMDVQLLPQTTRQTAVCVGEEGLILRTTDGGESWVSVQSPTTMHLNALCFASEQVGYIVGNSGTILKTEDAGLNWTTFSSSSANNLSAVTFYDENSGIAVGTQGNVLSTIDGGSTWSSVELGPVWLTGIQFLDANTAITVGYEEKYTPELGWYKEGLIIRSTDGGLSWTVTENDMDQPLFGAYFHSATEGIAVGGRGHLYITNDGGLDWTQITSPTTDKLVHVSFVDDQHGIAIGNKGTMLQTSDRGSTWESISDWLDAGFDCIYFLDKENSKTGYIAGTSGTLLQTKDKGMSWESKNSGTEHRLFDISFIGENFGMAVGERGTILKTSNRGNEWLDISVDQQSRLFAVKCLDSSNSIVVGEQGVALRTSDGGNTWHQMLQSNNDHRAIYFLDRNTGWITGVSEILKTTDGGGTWKQQYSNTSAAYLFHDLSFGDAENGCAVGYDWSTFEGVIIITSDGGNTWESKPPNTLNRLFGVHYYAPTACYIVGWNSTVLHSTNAGLVWVEPQSDYIATNIHLSQNYPNPVAQSTTIQYSLPSTDFVTLTIYNALGRIITTLVDDRVEAGTHTATWSPGDLPPGMYFYVLRTSSEIRTGKTVLLEH
ncbi:MAG: hypothetical protein CL946_01890 [Ectothiorhodospiraceae bacterium]|nr:hypothetical protein [Ectothiorhodospiraceae bacterium]